MSVSDTQNASDLQGRLPALLDQIAACRTRLDLYTVLTTITGLCGYRYFVLTEMPPVDAERLSTLAMISSAPGELINDWQKTGFLKKGRVVRRVRSKAEPFATTLDEFYADDRDDYEAVRRFTEPHEVNALAVIPVSHPVRGRAVAVFLGDPPSVVPDTLAALYLLAARIYDRLAEISTTLGDHMSPLSERERQCIAWTAAGKTSNEIASILGLSEHTVNHYLNNAGRKLGTVNRTQSVALCLRNHWID